MIVIMFREATPREQRLADGYEVILIRIRSVDLRRELALRKWAPQDIELENCQAPAVCESLSRNVIAWVAQRTH